MCRRTVRQKVGRQKSILLSQWAKLPVLFGRIEPRATETMVPAMLQVQTTNRQQIGCRGKTEIQIDPPPEATCHAVPMPIAMHLIIQHAPCVPGLGKFCMTLQVPPATPPRCGRYLQRLDPGVVRPWRVQERLSCAFPKLSCHKQKSRSEERQTRPRKLVCDQAGLFTCSATDLRRLS